MARKRTNVPTKPDDARAQRSIGALCTAFLDLLERKPLAQILIREITDAAGVSYPTFFRRFASTDELLEFIAAEEVGRLLGLGRMAIEQPNAPRRSEALCAYVQAHRKLWTTLLTGGAAPALRQEFMRVSKAVALARPRANPWLPLDLAVAFATSSVFEILAWWMRQPEDYPIDNVIKLFDALITDTMSRPRQIKLPFSGEGAGQGEPAPERLVKVEQVS